MSDDDLRPELYRPRSPDETRALYDDWAARYDADIAAWGYVTPARVATALAGTGLTKDAPILDFGCGTGLSGAALKAEGFATIDGTDISEAMLEGARARGVYRRVWIGTPGLLSIAPGDYAAIVAAGVVSLGAAPPETLDLLLEHLAPGGRLAFSYNDATLAEPSYVTRLDAALAGPARLLFSEHGPHLPGRDMGATIYVIEKR